MWLLVLALSLASTTAPAAGSIGRSDTNTPDPGHLPREQAALLTQWYERLGVPNSGETFGDFLVRSALLKRHSPYAYPIETNGPERLQVDLARFDCMSLIESSLAVARCAWLRETTEACFIRELVATRYRSGTMVDFTSRLHYVEDWLDDNGARKRLDDRTRDLGGLLLRRHFFYMTKNRDLFPPMLDPRAREAIALTEARLSERVYAVIIRSSIRHGVERLRNGDLVGVVTTEPGRLIGHTGLVVRSRHGATRFLHASSHHRRVTLTATSLTNYVLRRRERWGIIVARPLPPGHLILPAEDPTH